MLSSLFSSTLKPLTDHNEPAAYAAILRWENKHLILDGSANYANGIYMRLAMTFDGSLALEQVAKQLYAEELRIFKILDVEGESGE